MFLLRLVSGLLGLYSALAFLPANLNCWWYLNFILQCSSCIPYVCFLKQYLSREKQTEFTITMGTSATGNTSLGNITLTGNRTEYVSNFMAEAETFLTFKVAFYINYYWFPFLIPIGFVGNTLSFLVMIKPNNRKMSTCIYMAAISINGNLLLCLASIGWLVGQEPLHGIL